MNKWCAFILAANCVVRHGDRGNRGAEVVMPQLMEKRFTRKMETPTLGEVETTANSQWFLELVEIWGTRSGMQIAANYFDSSRIAA